MNTEMFCSGRFVDDIITNVLCDMFLNGAPRPYEQQPDIKTHGINIYPQENTLRNRYAEMVEAINDDNISQKEAFVQPDLKDFNREKLICNLKGEHFFAAGLDLPVFIGQYDRDVKRIMVVSCDPRRNFYTEMLEKRNCLALSTPFGWHNRQWRNSEGVGLLPQAVWELVSKKEGAFYFTDFYKFRAANVCEGTQHSSKKKDTSTIDNKNNKLYLTLLEKEIDLIHPTIVVTIGKEAKKGILAVSNLNANVVHLKHFSSGNAAHLWKYFVGVDRKMLLIKTFQHIINEDYGSIDPHLYA